jgi:hypothetical protein
MIGIVTIVEPFADPKPGDAKGADVITTRRGLASGRPASLTAGVITGGKTDRGCAGEIARPAQGDVGVPGAFTDREFAAVSCTLVRA